MGKQPSTVLAINPGVYRPRSDPNDPVRIGFLGGAAKSASLVLPD
jgi:hypothetical protein